MNIVRNILNIAYYECRALLREPILILMVLITPIAYACIFGFIYFNPIITNIPTAIIDYDSSDISREISDAYKGSPAFNVNDSITNYEDMKEAMSDGRIRCGVVIEKGIQDKIENGEQATVLAVYDASNLIWGYNIRKNVRLVINDFNTRWITQTVGSMGFDSFETEQLIKPVSYNLEVWYNPTYSYANFMLYGLYLMIIHQLGLLCIALAIPREREKGSWIRFQTAVAGKLTVFIGKFLPYFVIFLFHYLLILQMGIKFFHMCYYGSTFWLVVLGLVYVTGMLLIGYVFSCFISNSLQATRLIMLLSVPFVMISGMLWPSTHIPEYLNRFAAILPFTHAQKIMRIMAQKSGGWDDFSSSFIALIAIFITVFLLFLFFVKRQEKLSHGNYRTINHDCSYPMKKF